MLKMMNLEQCFNMAKIQKAQWVAVAIETRGNDGIEIIINPNTNFRSKLEYYKKAYTDDLVLKAYDGIKIVGFTFANSLNDIEADLVNIRDKKEIKLNDIRPFLTNDRINLYKVENEPIKFELLGKDDNGLPEYIPYEDVMADKDCMFKEYGDYIIDEIGVMQIDSEEPSLNGEGTLSIGIHMEG